MMRIICKFENVEKVIETDDDHVVARVDGEPERYLIVVARHRSVQIRRVEDLISPRMDLHDERIARSSRLGEERPRRRRERSSEERRVG